MDLTPTSLSLFFTGLKVSFDEGYGMPMPWWNQIAMQVSSDTELETWGWADLDSGVMREWLGPRIIHNTALRSRSLINKDWEKTKSVPKRKLQDDKYGLYSTIAKQMGWDAAKLHDQQLAALIRSNPECFDGKTFFASDHPQNIDKSADGTYDNDLGLALTPSNFGIARATMRSFKGRSGQPIGSEPSLLVVPPSLVDMALTITQAANIATLAAGGALGGGDVGTTSNIYQGSIKILMIKELEVDPTTWYLLDNEGIIKPFLVQVRQEANFVYLNSETDPNVFHNKEYIFGVDSRSAYDVTLPFKALRSVG